MQNVEDSCKEFFLITNICHPSSVNNFTTLFTRYPLTISAKKRRSLQIVILFF